jgi:hypothetical protein
MHGNRQSVPMCNVAAPRCARTAQVGITGGLMEQEHHIARGPFRLDVTHGRPWPCVCG